VTWILRANNLALAMFIAAASCGGPASGQTPPVFHDPHEALAPAVEPTAYRDLVERLEAAERRLAELEKTPNDAWAPSEAIGVSRVVQNDFDEQGKSDAKNGDESSDPVTKELQERLSEIESAWSGFQDAQDEAQAEAKNKPTFQIGGRIHLDYWTFMQNTQGIDYFEHPDPSDPQYGTDPENRFLFRRIRLEAAGDVPDLMFWRIQVDFNEPETPQIKDVYLGFDLPYDESLIIGHQKLPLGLDALYSSRFTTFMERPLVEDAFVTDYRRLGAMFYGYTDNLMFNWRYGVFSVEDIQRTGSYVGDSLQLGGYGRLAATPWYDETSDGRGYLHLGIAGSVVRPDGDVTDADSDTNVARFAARPEARTSSRWVDTGYIDGAQWYEQFALESVLNIGAVQFSGEFMATAVQRDSTTIGTGPDAFFHGAFVQASYFLTGEYVPWDRESGTIDRIHPLENFFLVDRCTGGTGSGWGAWQVAARTDYVDLTDADIRGGIEQNLTLALNWWWNPYARLQFDVTRGVIEQHRPIAGFDSGDFWLAGTRLAIDF